MDALNFWKLDLAKRLNKKGSEILPSVLSNLNVSHAVISNSLDV